MAKEKPTTAYILSLIAGILMLLGGGMGGMMGGMYGGWRGMMEAYPESTQMPINEDSSITYAQNYLDEYMPGAEATEPYRFYGYYTLHVEKDGNIIGMLSVNGFSGDVWYHNWHGDFVQILKSEHH